MSLKESAPLMSLIKIPVGGGYNTAGYDTERVNLFELSRTGLEGALYRQEPENAQQWQAAIDLMSKYQGQTIGIDTIA